MPRSLSRPFRGFREYAQSFSPYPASTVAFVLSPASALITRGKYYIAREGSTSETLESDENRYKKSRCTRCGHDYEALDMAHCPLHDSGIRSLCCTLEKECHDVCKKPGESIEFSKKPG